MLSYNDAIQYNLTQSTLTCYICHDEAPPYTITWFRLGPSDLVPVCPYCTTDAKSQRHTTDYNVQHTLNERS